MTTTPVIAIRAAVEALSSKLDDLVAHEAPAKEWLSFGFEISEVLLRGQGDLIEMQLVACKGGDVRLGARERREIHDALLALARLHRRAMQFRHADLAKP
jgi:hypothetical protein